MAGRNVANPTAMLLSAADMLDHIKYVGLFHALVHISFCFNWDYAVCPPITGNFSDEMIKLN